ncbi:hypothetical protein BH11BAC1_BH11BAC1_05870 [soil metagenome]
MFEQCNKAEDDSVGAIHNAHEAQLSDQYSYHCK